MGTFFDARTSRFRQRGRPFCERGAVAGVEPRCESRGLGEGLEHGFPFSIAVLDAVAVVEQSQVGDEAFKDFLLPALIGLITEVDAAAEGLDGVDGAEFAHLKDAGAGGAIWIIGEPGEGFWCRPIG